MHQVETRFGTKVMVCQSIMRSAEALQKLVMDERFTKAAASVDMAQVCIHVVYFSIRVFLLIDLRVGWPVSHLLLFLDADDPRLSHQLDLHC